MRGHRFRHCVACQSGVIFTLHGRSLSNVKEKRNLSATAIKAASPDATLVIAFDQTKPLLKAFASAGVDTKKLYFVAGLSNRFESM